MDGTAQSTNTGTIDQDESSVGQYLKIQAKTLFSYDSKAVLRRTCEGWNKWSDSLLKKHREFEMTIEERKKSNGADSEAKSKRKSDESSDKTEVSKRHDKKIFQGMQNDTIHAVALTQHHVAWASKNTEGFRVYVSHIDEQGNYRKLPKSLPEDGYVLEEKSNNEEAKEPEEYSVYEAKSMIGAMKLAYASPEKEGLQLATVDQNGNIQWLDVLGDGKLKTLKYGGENTYKGKLTALDIHRTNEDGKMAIAVGRDDGVVTIFSFDKESAVKNVNEEEFDAEEICNFDVSAKILDVRFLNTFEERSPEKRIHTNELVVADFSGFLSIYKLRHGCDNKYEPIIHFEMQYNLNVEPGAMVSCSDNGGLIAVGCGDSRARVLKRIHPLREIEGDTRETNEHDFWEESACFLLQTPGSEEGATILGVDISSDGSSLAVATEGSTEVFNIPLGCKMNSFISKERVRCLSLDDNGKFVVFGGFDKMVHCYNVQSGFQRTFNIKENEDSKGVQSVTIDAEGETLAIGTLAGGVKLYKFGGTGRMEESTGITVREKGADAYVVRLSPDGKLLAVGDYARKVTVYSTADLQTDGKKKVVFEKKFEDGKYGPCFIWGLDFVELAQKQESQKRNSVRLAVGCWDGFVYLYDFEGLTQKDTLKPLSYPERVYDVCFTEYGKQICFGGRHSSVHIYAWNDTDREYTLELNLATSDRLYCTALSPDGQYLAVGGFSKAVDVYNLKAIKSKFSHKLEDEDKSLPVQTDPELHVQSFTGHEKTISRVNFMDNETLVAVSEDGICGIYDVSSSDPLLTFPYQDKGNSVATNNKMIAVAYGCQVSVYGQRVDGYNARDRLSVDVAIELFDCEKSLEIALKSHPTLSNAVNASQSSLLHAAVKAKNSRALSLILEKGSPCGMFLNKEKKTPLVIAIQNDWRAGIEILLNAATKNRIVNSSAFFTSLFQQIKVPAKHFDPEMSGGGSNDKSGKSEQDLSLEEELGGERISSVFEILGKLYPSLLLSFLADLQIPVVDDAVVGNVTHMPLIQPAYIGLGCKSPKDLWSEYFEKYKHKDQSFDNKHGVVNKVLGKVIPIPGLAGHIIGHGNEERTKDLTKTLGRAATGRWKVAESAEREGLINDNAKNGYNGISEDIPCSAGTEGFRSMHCNRQRENSTQSRYDCQEDYLKAEGTDEQEPHHAISSPLEIIVQASRSVGDTRAFQKGSVVYHLVAYKWFILFPVWKTRTKKYCVYLGFSVLLGLFMTKLEVEDLVDMYTSWNILLVLLSAVLAYVSLLYLWDEFLQFHNQYKQVEHCFPGKLKILRATKEALKNYFIEDPWNVIDISCFPAQLGTDICTIFFPRRTSGWAAVSILLLVMKLNTFARGWKNFGPFVRMIQRIIQGMLKFVAFWLMLLVGFALAFDCLLEEEDGFQDFPSSFFAVTMMIYGSFDDTLGYLGDNYVAISLFQLLLFFNVVIMLNLLVAILSDDYAAVMAQSEDAILSVEIPNLILELENGLAHTTNESVINDEKDINRALYPKWIHILEKQCEDTMSTDDKLDKIIGLVEKIPK
mmetsp:Transcript_30334/g.40014  ORF Transcript_30334/g.40014 Transcript_30334/m.40014 type:complete len:1548 (-) Transcript_30334:496-5139(-)